MRILLICTWCPLPAENGASIRAWKLLQSLGSQHRVDLLAFAPESRQRAAKSALRASCTDVALVDHSPFEADPVRLWLGLFHPRPRSVVATLSPEMVAAVRSRLDRRYDLVVASGLAAARYGPLVPGVPRILDDFELGSQVDAFERATTLPLRARYWLSLLKARHYLRKLLRHYEVAVTVSSRERDLLHAWCSAQPRVEIVPNGADLAPPPDCPPIRDLLVYPGSLTYRPNLEAVRWFAESILPAVRRSRPSTRLLVTGVPLSGFEPAGVEQTGLLGDVRSTIASAWAEVVPLLSGSGTRVKVLEALALGTPVVSTSKGVEGLDVVPERDLLVADAADSFAHATCRLLADPLLRARLAEAGRQLVQSRYDWPASQRAWRCLAESVAEARPATLDLH